MFNKGRKIITLEMDQPTQKVDHRLGLTAMIYFFIMLPSSFMPEDTVLPWLIINVSFSLLVMAILFILWKRHQNDSVRYYSLQVYAMLMGIVFFCITPVFKLLYGSLYFWILLVFTILVVSVSHMMKNRIAKSFVNKKHKILLTIMSIYVILLIIIGIILMSIMRIYDSTENTAVSILFFLACCLFMVMSPAFLVRANEIEKLKK